MSNKFFSKVDIGWPDECWIWKGRPSNKGYGRHGGKYAHRVMMEHITGGDIPPGMQVDHLCFVRLCVNPAHLEIVTPDENNLRRRNVRDDCKTCHRPSQPTSTNLSTKNSSQNVAENLNQLGIQGA